MANITDGWLRAVLRLLYRKRIATRSEIAEATRLNVGSVCLTLGQLLRAGTVLLTGELRSHNGRRPDIIKLNGDAGYFVAVDLEPTRIRFAVVNLLGEIQHCREVDLQFGRKLEVSRLADGINGCIQRMAPIERSRLFAVGISVPGFVEEQDTITAVNLGWLHFRLLPDLQEAIGLPVAMDQDYRIGVFAEHWLGAAQNVQNCLYIKVGDGVGVGSIIDGHIIEGGDRMAGELGHITVDPNADDLCNCGKKGCLEAICSSPHMVRQYLELRPESLQNPSRIDVTGVFERARSGDAAALAVVDRAARCLGWAMSHLVHLANPHLILLGGEITYGYDLMLPRIRAELHRHCLPGLVRNLRLQVSSLWPEVGLKGAALVAFQKVLADPGMLRRLSGLEPVMRRKRAGNVLSQQAG